MPLPRRRVSCGLPRQNPGRGAVAKCEPPLHGSCFQKSHVQSHTRAPKWALWGPRLGAQSARVQESGVTTVWGYTGDTTPCLKSLRSSYTGLYPQKLGSQPDKGEIWACDFVDF